MTLTSLYLRAYNSYYVIVGSIYRIVTPRRELELAKLKLAPLKKLININLTFYTYMQTLTMQTLRICVLCAFGCLLASLVFRYTDTGRELNE